jgi:hypothetical protein
MSNESIFPRLLSAVGCQIVGTQLQTKANDYERQGWTLHPQVKSSALLVGVATAKVSVILRDGESMNTIDRGTDSAVSSFFGLLQQGAHFYSHRYAEVVPLSPEEDERRRLFVSATHTLFPDKTSFLIYPHREQWTALDALKARILSPEMQKVIIQLALTPEAERVLRWIDMYGARMGITGAKEGGSVSLGEAVSEWHEVWAEFMADVLSNYKGKGDPEAARLRVYLLEGFDEQAEAEREQERRARLKAESRKEGDASASVAAE